MGDRPYPTYPPSYRVVEQTGNYHRNCLVVELLSQRRLTDAQLCQICERVEAALSHLTIADLESCEAVPPQRFDRPLREGLRLSI